MTSRTGACVLCFVKNFPWSNLLRRLLVLEDDSYKVKLGQLSSPRSASNTSGGACHTAGGSRRPLEPRPFSGSPVAFGLWHLVALPARCRERKGRWCRAATAEQEAERLKQMFLIAAHVSLPLMPACAHCH